MSNNNTNNLSLARLSVLKLLLIRFTLVLAHCWLGASHFCSPELGAQFFRDELRGRKLRLKQNYVSRLFPGLGGK